MCGVSNEQKSHIVVVVKTREEVVICAFLITITKPVFCHSLRYFDHNMRQILFMFMFKEVYIPFQNEMKHSLSLPKLFI